MATCPVCGQDHDVDRSCEGEAETSRVGQVVSGKYRVVRLIGEGGMASVYEARHVDIERPFALKFLHPWLSSDEEWLERFRREASASGGIISEHVAAVIDLGITKDGAPFLVMEMLKGEDLGERLAREFTLKVSDAVEIVCQVCLGLTAAHRAGVIHRDLKPENIFLCEREAGGILVKILDFGIAKLRNSQLTRATRAGLVMGTPYYMSPEQATGAGDVDHRSDVYALGVILFELLSGGKPFVGEEHSDVLNQIVSGPIPDLRERCPELSAELSAVVHKAIARRVQERFHSAEEFAEALLPYAVRIRDRFSSVGGHSRPHPRTVDSLLERTSAEPRITVRVTGSRERALSPIGDSADALPGSKRWSHKREANHGPTQLDLSLNPVECNSVKSSPSATSEPPSEPTSSSARSSATASAPASERNSAPPSKVSPVVRIGESPSDAAASPAPARRVSSTTPPPKKRGNSRKASRPQIRELLYAQRLQRSRRGNTRPGDSVADDDSPPSEQEQGTSAIAGSPSDTHEPVAASLSAEASPENSTSGSRWDSTLPGVADPPRPAEIKLVDAEDEPSEKNASPVYSEWEDESIDWAQDEVLSSRPTSVRRQRNVAGVYPAASASLAPMASATDAADVTPAPTQVQTVSLGGALAPLFVGAVAIVLGVVAVTSSTSPPSSGPTAAEQQPEAASNAAKPPHSVQEQGVLRLMAPEQASDIPEEEWIDVLPDPQPESEMAPVVTAASSPQKANAKEAMPASEQSSATAVPEASASDSAGLTTAEPVASSAPRTAGAARPPALELRDPFLEAPWAKYNVGKGKWKPGDPVVVRPAGSAGIDPCAIKWEVDDDGVRRLKPECLKQ